AEIHEEHRTDTEQGLNPPRLCDNTPEDELVSVAEYIEWLMDRDRKSTSLKSLQGRIWEEGYKRGELRVQGFDDVPRALERWQKQEKKISIVSSGSLLAQKLLFTDATAGDLSRHIYHYFDKTAGSKTDKRSYQTIPSASKLSPF